MQQMKHVEPGGLRHDTYTQVAGLVLIIPIVMLLSLIIVGPFTLSVWRSLTDKATGGFTSGNYVWLLTKPDFLPAFLRSLYIAGGAVVLDVLVAVPLAILLNQPLPGRGILRAAVTLPWAIPTVAVATAFLWLSDTSYGLFNQVGLATGMLRQPVSVFGSPQLALSTVMVVHAWKSLPLVFIVVLSSLQSLPNEYLEAARVDGAWRLSQFWHIVIPHLRPSIVLAAVLSGIGNFALFDLTFLLTGGGPAGRTTTLPLLLYLQEFTAFDSGRSAAVGVAIVVVGAIALAGLFRLEAFDKRVRRS